MSISYRLCCEKMLAEGISSRLCRADVVIENVSEFYDCWYDKNSFWVDFLYLGKTLRVTYVPKSYVSFDSKFKKIVSVLCNKIKRAIEEEQSGIHRRMTRLCRCSRCFPPSGAA